MPDNFYTTFDTQPYNTLIGNLLTYRLDSFIREIESKEGPNKGNIFAFVRGLRFSALLTYEIRKFLKGSDLDVNWGQIIKGDGTVCSPECDVIIHKKGEYMRWNGDGDGKNIMDFRFIEQSKAVAVISCKSYLTKSMVEKTYCVNMLSYVSKVWLFAECCGPESVELITSEAKDIGYEHFWYLYTISKTKGEEQNVDGWIKFKEAIKALK